MNGSWKINTDRVNGQAQAFSDNATEIRNIAQQIIECKDQLSIHTGSAEVLKLRIAQLYDQALNAAAQMDTLKAALEEIVQLYVVTERRIVDNADGEIAENLGERSDDTTGGFDLVSLWRRFIAWLFGEDTDPTATGTTAAQEAAADAQMQQQIQDLCDTDRFSEDTWENATASERRQIIEEYMREVMQIMDLDLDGGIQFFNEAPSNGYITNGWYSSETDTMAINFYIIENYSAERSYALLTTVVHELRHAYQHAAIEDPSRYQVSQETIDRWSESFDNYRGTERIMREDGVDQNEAYRRYRAQAVEVDARSFAGQN